MISIQTRTLLRCSARQVTMPHDLRFREQFMKPRQDINHSFRLLRRTRIAWFTMFIQTTFIADADRTTVIRSRMCPHFEQEAMLRHGPILSDIKVVADVIETTALMVTSKLFHTIVLIASCSRAMQHQESHGVGRHYHLAVLQFREECAFIPHHLLPNTQRKFIINHPHFRKVISHFSFVISH